MNILENLLTPNKMSRPVVYINQVKKIVVHYVGNPGSSALANRNYFENLKNQNKVYASSQYIIGLTGEIIRCVPENEVTWHAGDLTTNYNSIGIECCHPDTTGKFNDATYNSLIELLKDLCTRYGLNPLTDIVRHYDVTGKKCPLYYVNNQNEWDKLKEDVLYGLYSSKLEEKEMEQIMKEINSIKDRLIKLEKGTPVADTTPKYTVTAVGVNVRQTPNLLAKRVALYNVGQHIFTILEDNGSWIRCSDGWIKKSFVKRI